jgi:hypothetical protein
MMNSQDFLACLRKTDDTSEITHLLSRLGVNEKLTMPWDDIEARVDLPELGLSLIFKPLDPKSNELTFAAVQFFSDAEPGYTSFDGNLPNNLSFSDSAAEVKKKLGRPSETKKEFRIEGWKTEDLTLTVNYAKDGRIAMVSLHVTEYY